MASFFGTPLDPEEYAKRQREAQERYGLLITSHSDALYEFLASLNFEHLKTYHAVLSQIDTDHPSSLSSWYLGLSAAELRHRFNWCTLRNGYIESTPTHVPDDLITETSNPDHPEDPHG